MAHHPQSDGQTEQINQEIEQYLHILIDHHHSNWLEWLSLAEFLYNSKTQTSLSHPPSSTMDTTITVTNSSLKRPSYHSGARSFLLGPSPTLAPVLVLFNDWSKTRFQEVPQPLHCLPCMEGDSHDSPM